MKNGVLVLSNDPFKATQCVVLAEHVAAAKQVYAASLVCVIVISPLVCLPLYLCLLSCLAAACEPLLSTPLTASTLCISELQLQHFASD